MVNKTRPFAYAAIMKNQQFNSYLAIMKLIYNQTRKTFVPVKFRQKVNESTPNYKNKLKHQQSINPVKDEINILEEREKHWLIKLNDYDKNIQQFIKTLNLPNYNEESMIAKYRCKVKEGKTRNVNNWNEHFDKLKETHSEEQDSNEIDNEHFGKLKETHSEEQDSNEIDNNTTAIHKDFKFIKCTTHPR